MARNLRTTYSTLLDKRYMHKSITEAACGHDYSWEGSEAIKVWTIGHGTLQTYDPTRAFDSRLGANVYEMSDEINTYQLSKNITFRQTIDGVLNQDQANIMKANAIMKQIWDEDVVPEIDKYRLSRWANGAGQGVINATALTKSTVVEALLNAGAALDNAAVPHDGRICFMPISMTVKTRLATELQYNDKYTEKNIVNGMVTHLDNMPIVGVPDTWMPTGIEFMIKHKKASADPQKLKMLRSDDQVPGLYGTLLEGLVRTDAFVLANKADGIFLYSQSGVAVTPTITISSHTVTITSTGATSIKYTTDGTNPKVSATAKTYDGSEGATPVTVTAGTVVKAYATKTGSVDSAIASAVDA